MIPERGPDEEDSCFNATPGPGKEYTFSEQQSILKEKEKSMRSSILEEQLSLPRLKTNLNDSNHLTTGKTERERMVIRGSIEKTGERESIFQKLSRSQMGADGMQLSHSDANINVSVLHADIDSSELNK